ncbi:hypothetical protein BWI93_12185 [Siphonobacter sp. BAB-5385]|nr:hypothetical protein BWI93_12185 [Siphonobacter sp. BAB-5385]
MKTFIWIILLLTMGCRKQPEVLISITPDQLVGTWKDPSSKVQLGKRLTFTETHVYRAVDSVANCQPVEPNKALPYTYTLDKGSLVLTYAGVMPGMQAPPPLRLSIVSFSSTHLLVRTPVQEQLMFEKCE